MSQPEFSDDSGDEYESDALDSNDELRLDLRTFDHFNLLGNDRLGPKDDNVAVYMGNWAVKKILRRTKCKYCESMLELRNDNRDPLESPMDETMLRAKSFSNMAYKNKSHLGYDRIIREEVKVIFKRIFHQFRDAAVESLNDQGKAIGRNIFRHIRNDHLIFNWLNDCSETCQKHGKIMVRLIITTKVFLLIKKRNSAVVQSKSFNQTRRQLRHQ